MKELPKKYNTDEIEDKWKKYWERENVFKFSSNDKKPFYIVDTPPPYVSADHLHAGHIMSYAQAEFIVRYKRMKGFNVFYPMGFDDNGLPTERFVEKKCKVNKGKTTRAEFIKLCLEETKKGAKTYKNLWNNLGISVDWSKTYSTISPLATKVSQWSIIDLYKKKALYRKKAPVLWCSSCRTAIAQADLEDQEETSKINYINFKSIKNNSDLTIATTRPELLPACVALYVNPNDKRYIDLIDTEATVPLFNYSVPILKSDKVDMEFGTGLMMVCTWGDKEDMEKWQSDKLETRALVREDGKLNELGKQYEGMKIKEARQQIIIDLKEQNLLVKQEDITHTLNIHERCGTPVEFVQSKQWFIKIVNKKAVWMEYAKKINWYPDFKSKTYKIWVDSIKWDWCISRQRYYGVPFPIWYCAKCNEPIMAQEKDLPVDPFEDNPPVSACPKCGHKKFIPEKDVLDTWATSSCTPFLLRELVDDENVKKKLFPTTLRPNAFEIIRTWDFYSIVKSHYHFNKIPFENIMVSGHGVDEKGKKISKRLENYTPSEQLINNYGADAVRYWATGANLGQNLRFNIQEIQKGKRTTIKLWNVARFISMNLENFKFSEKIDELECADTWILEELNKTLKKVSSSFENYTYAKVRDEVDTFFWSKFADYYVEFVKYRIFGDDQKSKETAQQVLVKVFLVIQKMYAPIIPFVTEEIYQQMYKKYDKNKSIHISQWPDTLNFDTTNDISDFGAVISAVDEIRKYKSENNLSLGTELETLNIQTKVDLDKYGDFIEKVSRVKKLSKKI